MVSSTADDFHESLAVILGLGANIGDPADNIFKAFAEIKSRVLEEARLSSLYITAPQDVSEQPDFINAACIGNFTGSARSLLIAVNHIEKEFGRNRSMEKRRGPRLIDIDILYFGGHVISFGEEGDGEGKWLRIPHERLTQRKFELVPLLELTPDLTDPLSGDRYHDINERLSGQGIYSFDAVRYIKDHGAKRGR